MINDEKMNLTDSVRSTKAIDASIPFSMFEKINKMDSKIK
jgi:hypothetical protein